MKNLHTKRTTKFRKSVLLQLKLPKYYKRMLFKSTRTNIIICIIKELRSQHYKI